MVNFPFSSTFPKFRRNGKKGQTADSLSVTGQRTGILAAVLATVAINHLHRFPEYRTHTVRRFKFFSSSLVLFARVSHSHISHTRGSSIRMRQDDSGTRTKTEARKISAKIIYLTPALDILLPLHTECRKVYGKIDSGCSFFRNLFRCSKSLQYFHKFVQQMIAEKFSRTRNAPRLPINVLILAAKEVALSRNARAHDAKAKREKPAVQDARVSLARKILNFPFTAAATGCPITRFFVDQPAAISTTKGSPCSVAEPTMAPEHRVGSGFPARG